MYAENQTRIHADPNNETSRLVDYDSISGYLSRGDRAGASAKFKQFRDALHAEVEAYQRRQRKRSGLTERPPLCNRIKGV